MGNRYISAQFNNGFGVLMCRN